MSARQEGERLVNLEERLVNLDKASRAVAFLEAALQAERERAERLEAELADAMKVADTEAKLAERLEEALRTIIEIGETRDVHIAIDALQPPPTKAREE